MRLRPAVRYPPMATDSDSETIRPPENLASFFLTVGAVSIAFWAVFVFAFSGLVRFLLVTAVLVIAVFSMVVGWILNMAGEFDDTTATAETDSDSTGTEQLPEQAELAPPGDRVPLPKLLNFDQELNDLAEYIDADSQQFRTIWREYAKLKTESRNRQTIASSMRSGVNGLRALASRAQEPEAEAIVEDIGDRLFEYISAEPAEKSRVTSYAFFDESGTERPVTELQETKARVRASVRNRSDEVKLDVVFRFTDGNGVQVRKSECPLGVVPPDAEKTLDTKVYVPSVTGDVEAFAAEAQDSREVLDM